MALPFTDAVASRAQPGMRSLSANSAGESGSIVKPHLAGPWIVGLLA